MQQEILIILRSSFADSQMESDIEEKSKRLSPEERLEEACANGTIKNFLPEVFKNAEHKIYLWQLHPGFSFLQLELGEAPLEIELRHSITPRYFLAAQNYN